MPWHELAGGPPSREQMHCAKSEIKKKFGELCVDSVESHIACPCLRKLNVVMPSIMRACGWSDAIAKQVEQRYRHAIAKFNCGASDLSGSQMSTASWPIALAAAVGMVSGAAVSMAFVIMKRREHRHADYVTLLA